MTGAFFFTQMKLSYAWPWILRGPTPPASTRDSELNKLATPPTRVFFLTLVKRLRNPLFFPSYVFKAAVAPTFSCLCLSSVLWALPSLAGPAGSRILENRTIGALSGVEENRRVC
jgi:hypothetical protein